MLSPSTVSQLSNQELLSLPSDPEQALIPSAATPPRPDTPNRRPRPLWCRTWKGAGYPPKASRTVYGRRRDQLEVAGTGENLR